jgi:hypothetical protein
MRTILKLIPLWLLLTACGGGGGSGDGGTTPPPPPPQATPGLAKTSCGDYQGNDRGTQYRSVIFTHSEAQTRMAQEVVQELLESGIYSRPIVTQIQASPTIFPAEDYHQNYFQQHPGQGYCMAVVAPKLAKFRAKFKARIAPEFV